MAACGIDNVTIRQITDRADVASGTFYNHFADLTELEAEIIDLLTASVNDLEGFLRASDDVVGVTGSIFGRLIGFAVQHPHTASVFGQLLAAGRAEAPRSDFIEAAFDTVRNLDEPKPATGLVPRLLSLVMAGVVLGVVECEEHPTEDDVAFYISVLCTAVQFEQGDKERATKVAIAEVARYLATEPA